MSTPRPVLVVDDDRDIREAIADVLRDEGYDVRLAANGREALADLAHGDRPGLILLDLSMPVMSGTEFRRIQLADDALAGIPTAVISAAGAMHDMIRGLGIHVVLPKPVALDALVALARRYCAPHAPQQGAAP